MGRGGKRRAIRPRDNDAVGVPAKQSINRLKAEHVIWCKAKTGVDKVLLAQPLKYVPAVKYIPRAQRVLRVDHPVVLNPAQALASNRAGAEILPDVGLRLTRCRRLDHVVDRGIDRRSGTDGTIEVHDTTHSEVRVKFAWRPSAVRQLKHLPGARSRSRSNFW